MADQTIFVDTSKVANSHFQGVGTNISSPSIQYPWPAPALETVKKRLAAMEIPKARVWFQLNAHKTIASDLNSGDNWQSEPWKRIETWARLLGDCNTQIQYCPLGGGPYSVPPEKPTYSTAAWAREAGKQIQKLMETPANARVVSAEVVNEPKDDKGWQRGLSFLRDELDARGFGKIAVNGPGFYRNSVLQNEAWWNSRGNEWSHHLYFGLDEWNYETGGLTPQLKSARNWLQSKNPPQPLILGEFGDNRFKGALPDDPNSSADSQRNIRKHRYGLELADMTIQAMNAGVQHLDSWMLDESGRYDPKKPQSVKNWGLWEPHELDPKMSLRPWFYAHFLLSKYAWADSTVFEIDFQHPDLRITALKRNGSQNWTLLALNKGATNAAIRFQMSARGAGKFQRYVYSNPQTDAMNSQNYAFYAQDKDGFPVATEVLNEVAMADGLALELPRYSLSVLTGTIE